MYDARNEFASACRHFSSNFVERHVGTRACHAGLLGQENVPARGNFCSSWGTELDEEVH